MAAGQLKSLLFYRLQAKSQFKRRSTANNVEIHIPVPPDADSPKFKVCVYSGGVECNVKAALLVVGYVVY